MAEQNDNQKSPISALAAELRKQTGSSRKALNSQTTQLAALKKIGESVIRLEQLAKINTVTAEKLQDKNSQENDIGQVAAQANLNLLEINNDHLQAIREILSLSSEREKLKNLNEKRSGGLEFNALAKSMENLRAALSAGKNDSTKPASGGSLFDGLGKKMAAAGGGLLKAAGGIAAMGVAIPAFLGGLAIGSKFLDLASDKGIGDLDFAGIKKGMIGLSGMIGSIDSKTLTVLGGLIGISAFAGIKGSKGYDSALSLGLMGASIVAFIGGLAIGSTVLDAAEGIGLADLDFGGLKKGFDGLGSMISSLDKTTITVLGGLIGIAGFAGYKAGPKIAASIALMGISLSAFIGGLAAGNSVLDAAETKGMADLNFSAMKKGFKGLSESVGSLSKDAIVALGGLIGVSAAFSAIKVKPTAFAGTMIMMSAGIMGFLGGLALGELALGAAGGAGIDLDFPAVKESLKGFSSVVGSLTVESITALGGIAAAAAALSVVKVKPGAFAASMLMIGAGVIGLLGGFALGDLALAEAGAAGLDFQFPAIKSAMEGFDTVAGSITAKSVAVLGTLIGSAVLLSKGGFTSGLKFASAMAFIGAGIVGLMGGFVLGEQALATVPIATLQFDSIKAAMEGFSNVMGAVDTKAIAGLSVIMATAVLLSKGGFATGPKFALAMSFIGAGIAGFLGGLAIGDAALTALDGSVVDLNFPSMKKAFVAFDDLLGSLSGTTLTAMAGLMAAGGILSLIGGFGGGPAFALAMTGIGAGIGGFLVGFDGIAAAGAWAGLDGSAIADLMTNIADGAKAFDGTDMLSLSIGLGLLGPAMLLLLGSEGLGGLAEGAMNFFKKVTGQEDTGGIFGKINRALGDPNQLDTDAINKLTESVSVEKATQFSVAISKIGEAITSITGEDKGFLGTAYQAAVDALKTNPFEPFIKLGESGDKIFRAGIGIEKATSSMSTKDFDKDMLTSIIDFAQGLGEEQDKLEAAASSLTKIAKAVRSINKIEGPSGSIMNIGNENVNLSGEMMVSQVSLDNLKTQGSAGGAGGTVVTSTDASTQNQTINNSYVQEQQPETRDWTDYKSFTSPVAR